jgi:hypothetical protein
MGFLSTINARIANAMRRRGGEMQWVRVSVVDIRLTAESANGARFEANWKDLQQVVGLRRDLYGGDQASVLLAFNDCLPLEIPSTCEGWIEVCREIEALPGAESFGVWHARLLDMPIGTATEIWSAPRRDRSVAGGGAQGPS